MIMVEITKHVIYIVAGESSDQLNFPVNVTDQILS